MTIRQRNAAGRSPLGRGSRRGRDYRPLILLAAAVGVLALLVWLALSLLGGDGGCEELFCSTDVEASAPDGFERVTRIFERNGDHPDPDPDTIINVALPLTGDTGDGRNLSLFAFDRAEGEWTALAPASVDDEGRFAAADIAQSPAMIAVLQRSLPVGEVIAHLPTSGVALHPEAAQSATIVHTYDLRPTGDGSLEGTITPPPEDAGYRSIPVSWAGTGRDDGSLAAAIAMLSTPSVRTAHVTNLVAAVEAAGVEGIAIAYLDLPTEHRTSFTLFVAELAQALHLNNKELILILDPPQRAGDGFDEGAYDWAALGAQADLIEMMPYLDQRLYRVVVPEVLTYLTELMPAQNLVLGVTPMSTVIGRAEEPEAITIVEAMRIATRIEVRGVAGSPVLTESNYEVVGVNIDRNVGSGLAWDPGSAAVVFSYQDASSGAGVTIYLENALSVGYKLEYVNRYGLGGLAVVDAGVDVNQANLWPGIAPFIAGGTPVLSRANDTILSPAWAIQEPEGGTLESPARGSVRWTTPEQAGQYTITLTLSDGVDEYTNRLPVVVTEREPAAGG